MDVSLPCGVHILKSFGECFKMSVCLDMHNTNHFVESDSKSQLGIITAYTKTMCIKTKSDKLLYVLTNELMFPDTATRAHPKSKWREQHPFLNARHSASNYIPPAFMKLNKPDRLWLSHNSLWDFSVVFPRSVHLLVLIVASPPNLSL